MIYSNIGENIKKLRKSRNLTQKELGARVGLSKAVISKYENGMGQPDSDMLIRIARLFGVTTDYLLGVDNGQTVSVSGLTDTQIETIQRLIAEFHMANEK